MWTSTNQLKPCAELGEFSCGTDTVGADHVNDGLPLDRVVLRQPFQRVQTAEPDRGLLRAELINRAGVQLDDALLSGVSLDGLGDFALVLQGLALVLQGLLGGPLAASGQQQRNSTTSGDCDSAGGAYRVQLHAGIGAAIEASQHGPRCHGDPEHERGPQHDRPSRQRLR